MLTKFFKSFEQYIVQIQNYRFESPHTWYLTEEHYLEIFGLADEAEAILFVTARALTADHSHGSFSHINVQGVPKPQ